MRKELFLILALTAAMGCSSKKATEKDQRKKPHTPMAKSGNAKKAHTTKKASGEVDFVKEAKAIKVKTVDGEMDFAQLCRRSAEKNRECMKDAVKKLMKIENSVNLCITTGVNKIRVDPNWKKVKAAVYACMKKGCKERPACIIKAHSKPSKKR